MYSVLNNCMMFLRADRLLYSNAVAIGSGDHILRAVQRIKAPPGLGRREILPPQGSQSPSWHLHRDFALPPSAKNAAITYWLSMKPRRRPLARCALFLRLAAPLASSYNISIGPDIPPTSWDRPRSQQHFHNASRPTQDQRIPLARRSGYAVPHTLLLKFRVVPVQPQHAWFRRECPLVGHFCGPSVTRVAVARALLVTLHGQAAQCMRLFANRHRVRAGTPPVELLPGESISNAYRISRHDLPKRRGPHALLLLLPEVAPTCPCTRSRFTLRTPDPLPSSVRCALPQGSLIAAPTPTSYAAALSASALTSA
ncbi:hypothetical protein B0H14DRAFT_3728596 [Mycena olivaceomarginata]|nr:hypothetical protein B0H14DRAFT_3728596 [Mycena olivaceomarginata]